MCLCDSCARLYNSTLLGAVHHIEMALNLNFFSSDYQLAEHENERIASKPTVNLAGIIANRRRSGQAYIPRAQFIISEKITKKKERPFGSKEKTSGGGNPHNSSETGRTTTNTSPNHRNSPALPYLPHQAVPQFAGITSNHASR